MTYDRAVATAVVTGLALGLILAVGLGVSPLVPVGLALLFGVLVPR